MNKLLGLYCGLLLIAPLVMAEEEPAPGFAPVPEPPTLPAPVHSGEALEPEITIIETEKEVIQEYRIDGRLYMVKITPAAGPAYYLLDSDGDGELDVRKDDVRNISVPQWVLFSWD